MRVLRDASGFEPDGQREAVRTLVQVAEAVVEVGTHVQVLLLSVQTQRSSLSAPHQAGAVVQSQNVMRVVNDVALGAVHGEILAAQWVCWR